MFRLVKIWLCLFLITGSVIKTSVYAEGLGDKNILLINSYHQGYAWTDSLTSGILIAIKFHPEYNLFIEYLDSKQFGKSNFEVEIKHFQTKYSGIKFDGIIVSDNDALDLLMRYENEFSPEIPVVFLGISNPEDYLLEGSRYYGIKETGSTNGVVNFVHNLLPDLKRLLIITDHTTTGLIYRKEFVSQAQEYDKLKVFFPDVIDMDTIYGMVSSKNDYDAIYYIGISQDKNGRLVDPVPLAKQICLRAKVPIFTNDPIYNGVGVVGGLFQSGKKHGTKAVDLLVKLLHSNSKDSVRHINTTEGGYFFDRELIDRFQIPVNRIPAGALIINQQKLIDKDHFWILFLVLAALSLVVAFLTVVNYRRKLEHKKSTSRLLRIQASKIELEDAHSQLGVVISELEDTNLQLKDSNIKLEEAKKKAEESDNLKSAFLANVSHEIRTPLNSIVGFSSLLSDPDLNTETRNSYIELIESNTESLLVLIDEIIDLSKIEAQQLTLKKQMFSIDSLMTELLQIFKYNHQNLNVELRIEKLSDTKELLVFSDRVRIKQIFINLLSNAGKFTASGFIEFGYQEHEIHGIVIYVKDTGIGISKENHQAVFHRFRKLNENSGKVFRGTGLGLAITQKLVELLGGKIWIESELGKGACFFFTIDKLTLQDVTE